MDKPEKHDSSSLLGEQRTVVMGCRSAQPGNCSSSHVLVVSCCNRYNFVIVPRSFNNAP